MAFTSPSTATLQPTANAEPSGQSEAVSFASPRSMSATQTFAPSPVNTIAPSRPMPPPPPVITQTLPSSRPAIASALRREQHVRQPYGNSVREPAANGRPGPWQHEMGNSQARIQTSADPVYRAG